MKNKAVIILIVLSLIFLIIGSTLAYWTWSSNNLVTVNITTNMGGIGLTFNGGTQAVNGLAPAACTHSTYANVIPVTISRYNETGNPAMVDLTLKVTSFTWTHTKPVADDLQYINVALTSSSSSCSNPVVSGNLANISVNNSASTAQAQNTELMTWNYVLPANSVTQSVPINETYYLYVWLSSEYTYENVGNNVISDPLQDISFTVTWNASSIDQVESLASTSLYRYIESVADTTTTIDFSGTSGTGIFRLPTTASDPYPVYYYRGSVTNNNVYFANKCWKIVRTTSTGGVKMIYNGLNTGTSEQPACNNTGTDSQLPDTVAFNTNYTSPADVGYMYGARYASAEATGTGWKYAPDVTYSNGTYTLTSKEVSGTTYNVETKADITGINLNYLHYTCGSSTDTTCSQVRYVYYVSGSYASYITLLNGKKVEDALNEMLTNSTDTNDSTIKAYIDDWYSDSTKGNMTGYTQYLEDTIWCNDRSIYQLNGWNPEGGSVTSSYLNFGYYGRQSTPIVTCPNKHDVFTVNDVAKGNGKLTYPIGLITADEVKMAGPSSTSYLTTGDLYWAGSPSVFSVDTAYGWYVNSPGSFGYSYVDGDIGVRPLVSLKPGMTFSGGDGSVGSPFIIE